MEATSADDPSSWSIRAVGPLRAAPATMGDTATLPSRRAATASRTPGTASTGSIDTTGLDGAITTTSADSMASRTPGPGRAASIPSKRTFDTATPWPSLTKYSWKPTSAPPPSAAASVTRVSIGSSLTGSTRHFRPRAAAMRAVISLNGRPRASSEVRNRWVPRSRSPSANQASSPQARSSPRAFQVSSARPHPVAGLTSPARV